MSGWVIGYVLGTVIVLVVVAILLLMIAGAQRAATRAEEILAALRDAERTTLGLWEVAKTNAAADRIVAGATAAREALETRGGRR